MMLWLTISCNTRSHHHLKTTIRSFNMQMTPLLSCRPAKNRSSAWSKFWQIMLPRSDSNSTFISQPWFQHTSQQVQNPRWPFWLFHCQHALHLSRPATRHDQTDGPWYGPHGLQSWTKNHCSYVINVICRQIGSCELPHHGTCYLSHGDPQTPP